MKPSAKMDLHCRIRSRRTRSFLLEKVDTENETDSESGVRAWRIFKIDFCEKSLVRKNAFYNFNSLLDEDPFYSQLRCIYFFVLRIPSYLFI